MKECGVVPYRAEARTGTRCGVCTRLRLFERNYGGPRTHASSSCHQEVIVWPTFGFILQKARERRGMPADSVWSFFLFGTWMHNMLAGGNVVGVVLLNC